MSLAYREAVMMLKPIIVTIVRQEHQRRDWFVDFEGTQFAAFFDELTVEMGRMGISLTLAANHEITINVNSYADLLNSIKLSSPQDNHHNQCVGHIIDKSEHLDIHEDIRRAVRRLAFAPETIAPETAFRKVCHNCGCGC